MKLELTHEELDIIETWYECHKDYAATRPSDIALYDKLCDSHREQLIERAKANQPKIIFTARALLDKDVFVKFCDMRGFDGWAIAEGQMSDTEEFRLTLDEARELGLL